MGFKKNRFKIICGVFLLCGCLILTTINLLSNKGIYITEWDNYYNENNIVFFYEDTINEKLEMLNSKYKIKEQVSDSNSEFDKVFEAVSIARNMMDVDNVISTSLNNGYDILLNKSQSNKISSKDMAIVARDFVNCLGIKSRIGLFRKADSKYHLDVEYYVLEYWSTEYNKWIMIDVSKLGYFEDEDRKLSAVEVMNSDMKKVSFISNVSQMDYKNVISRFFDSYTLSIENSSQFRRSNCNVTYIKNDYALEYKIKNKFIPPTVFTKETKLFEKSPFNKLVGEDEKAYLLICKPASDNDEDKEQDYNSGEKIFITAFKDDMVLNSFYLNVNSYGYEKIEHNKEVELKKGENTIELSLDGENTISSMTIDNK